MSASFFSQRFNLKNNVAFAIGEFTVNLALVFVSYRLVIVHAGLEAIGVWATLYAWVNLVRLGDAGVAGAAARFLALYDPDRERDLIRAYGETALVTNLAQFSFLSLICYAGLSPLTDWIVGDAHAAEAAAVLPYLVAGFFLLNISGGILGVLQGLHLGYRRSQLSVLGTLIQLVAVVILAPGYGLVGLALAQILQHAIVAVLGWSVAQRALGGDFLPWRFDRAAFRAMLGYSLQAQAVNIANGLIEPVSKMLVGHFGGMTSQALFELAYKTVLLPRSLVGAGAGAAAPALTALHQSDRAELRRLYARMFRFCLLAMTAATAGLIVFAPIPSWLWLGRVDETYWLYVSLMAGGFFFNGIGMPAYLLGMASGRMGVNISITLMTLVCLIPVGYMLGLGFGGVGCVGASAGAIGFCGALILIKNRKLLLV